MSNIIVNDNRRGNNESIIQEHRHRTQDTERGLKKKNNLQKNEQQVPQETIGVNQDAR